MLETTDCAREMIRTGKRGKEGVLQFCLFVCLLQLPTHRQSRALPLTITAPPPYLSLPCSLSHLHTCTHTHTRTHTHVQLYGQAQARVLSRLGKIRLEYRYY